MSGATDTGREIYVTGLRNQHAVENQAIELLERQIGWLEHYPEMVDRMRVHVTESQEQARRIEALLIGHTVAPDEVFKNSFANQAFEHFEIAAYKSLLVLAEAVGHRSAATALSQSLQEEQNMATWIDEHLKPTTLRFLERSVQGQTAGV